MGRDSQVSWWNVDSPESRFLFLVLFWSMMRALISDLSEASISSGRAVLYPESSKRKLHSWITTFLSPYQGANWYWCAATGHWHNMSTTCSITNTFFFKRWHDMQEDFGSRRLCMHHQRGWCAKKWQSYASIATKVFEDKFNGTKSSVFAKNWWEKLD